MKILTIDLQGFGPFRRRQTINFDRFDEEGLFLIGGKTGAGKSSILDAITFALYAHTPRYDGQPRGVRSNFAELTEDTYVTLEFDHGGERYRITRSPEYEVAKKRGTGTTIRKSEASLEQWQQDDWRGLASSAREVAEKLQEIFPLSATEFLQVVMLAQNQFQKFLQAESKDRQELLRKLFRTYRYKTVSDLLAERAKVSGQKLTQLNDKLEEHRDTLQRRRDEFLPKLAATAAETGDSEAASEAVVEDSLEAQEITGPWLLATGELIEDQYHQREIARDQAAVARAETAEALRLAVELRARQDRRAKAEASRQTLLADQDRLQQEVISRLEIDAEAAPLIHLVDAANSAELKLAGAIESQATARQQLGNEMAIEAAAGRPVALEESATNEEIRSTARALTEVMGSLRENEDIDGAISAKVATADQAQKSVEDAETALGELRQQIEQRPEARSKLVTSLATENQTAAGLDAASEGLTLARTQLSAVEALPKAEQATTAAAQELDRALASAEAASRIERELINRRWLGAASSLAQDLVEGEPCQVCGSREHPNPARSEVEPVTDKELHKAEQAAKAAHQGTEKYRTALDAARQEAEKLRTLSGGLDLDDAQAKHDTAKESVKKAKSAGARIATLEAELAALDASAESDNERLESLNAVRDEARARLTTTEEQLRDLRSRAEDLRGQFASVRERLARAEAIEAACQSLLAAAESVTRARQQRVEADKALEVALEPSRFADAEDVLRARLDEKARERLRSERERHAKDLHAAEQALADPELDGLPADPVDVESPKIAANKAQEMLDEANQSLGVAETVLKDVRATVQAAQSILRELAKLGDHAAAERELASTLNGQNERKQNLEAFVLAAYLEDVLAAANARLGSITANRYELELDDDLATHGRQSGLGLKIFDVYNGKSRQPKSLSGGETFLVSLALALGLADVVPAQAGGITLDTLFIDEGFGSLDSDTLEIAMRTLDQLREGGRMIGVISHVGSMQERIPAHLNVQVSADGSSDISMEAIPELVG